MTGKRILKAVVMIGAVVLCTALVTWLRSFGQGLTVTVQATVVKPDGKAWIRANDAASVSSGEHGAPFRDVRMKDGTLVCGAGYGPIAVKGAVSRAGLLQACPSLPLAEDWPFTIGMFNTSDDNRVRIYLDLVIDAAALDARATLYLFYEGYAHPMIYEQAVAVGEDFGFGVEY